MEEEKLIESESKNMTKNNWTDSLLKIFGYIFTKTAVYSPIVLLPVLLLLSNSFVHSWLLILLFIPLATILFLAVLYKIQDLLLYHPSMPENSNLYVPFPTGADFEIVNIVTPDGETLHGYLLKQPPGVMETVPTLIYFHGNAGNAGSPCVLPLHTFCKVNVLVMDYRGYGKSTGYPSEEGLYVDGESCIRYLNSRDDVDPNKIVLFGHSLGGAVAIHLGALMQQSDFRIAALILENTFTDIPRVAKYILSMIPGISRLPRFCYRNKFVSIEKIRHVTVPILFISGKRDQIVMPEMMRQLMNASENPHSVLISVTNGSHNDTWCSSPIYHSCVTRFLRKVFNEDMQEEDNDSKDSDINFTWKTEIVAN